ncbi:hypothetical protein M758_7G007300 [Ceratodon purpureus]|uniref:Uncharacterized protein n=1 Tax=Ceratodon purpureus TaxID=3225 RepID=A0A8T0H0R2_CERPU|nr:hypothetical protein KC19_7G007700 [Ceratodon purpureus]KAG0609699.1 hypothetical protein M758_7G007300 [Ceratodon purpureus]
MALPLGHTSLTELRLGLYRLSFQISSASRLRSCPGGSHSSLLAPLLDYLFLFFYFITYRAVIVDDAGAGSVRLHLELGA